MHTSNSHVTNIKTKRLGYLSGAPRVSTDPNAEASGPRSHVLGVINAFETLGWTVHRFIVGDRMPAHMQTGSTRKAISGGWLRTLAADTVRLTLGQINTRRAWKELGGNVDIVYERFAVLQVLGRRFARHGIPWIIETSGPFFYEAKTERNRLVLTGLAKRIELRAYQDCDLLVCVSQSLKGIIIDAAPTIDSEKIIVLPNGVDTKFLDPHAVDPLRIFDGFTIGYVGALLDWQSIDSLIRVVHDLRQDSVAIHLVIIGDGPANANLRAMTARLDMESYVHFTGRVPRDKIPQYIAGFDVGYSGQKLLAIGKMYHSPLKIYEYMAMGKPVIASDFDDARRVTRNGELGFLFEGGNSADLRRSIMNAYRNNAQSASFHMKIRNEIVNHHSWVSRVEELLIQMERRGLL